MSLECGIVGLPNVGKSTLFNALTSAENAEAANYPFCTIDPNVGVVNVPDPRLDFLNKCFNPKSLLPATVSFVDIAGLVKGASQGEGLGNQFLGHIKSCHAIAQVVRCFEDENVVHVAGKVDPISDLEVIETELLLADLATLEKRIDRLKKLAKSGGAETKAQLESCQNLEKLLQDGRAAREWDASEEALELLKDLHLITMKPMIVVANVSEEDAQPDAAEKNPHYQALGEYCAKKQMELLPICGKIESELSQLDDDEQAEFLKELGIEESGLNRLIRAAYKTLGLRTYFTAGEKEVRAWTFRDGWKAPKAAGVIHGDFERGFIRAEAYHFDELVEHGSEAKLKELGKVRVEGKDYTVKDGDLLHFRFNV